MKLSGRMRAVAGLVRVCGVLADVGTDHGYVPIALVAERKVRCAIAMDIKEGPLSRARKNIADSRMEDRIKTRLSDGVSALAAGEADSILIAGMGGRLVVHILASGAAVCRSAEELILQPQSDLRRVREYLRQNGYRIAEEDMVWEDGKYYPMLRALPGEAKTQKDPADPVITAACDIYGPLLLAGKHPVLRRFLDERKRQLAGVLDRLLRQPDSEAAAERIRQLGQELLYCETAQKILGEG